MFHLGGMEIFNIKKDTFQFVPRRGLKWEYYNLAKILGKGNLSWLKRIPFEANIL
jgi:hypothetical protein